MSSTLLDAKAIKRLFAGGLVEKIENDPILKLAHSVGIIGASTKFGFVNSPPPRQKKGGVGAAGGGVGAKRLVAYNITIDNSRYDLFIEVDGDLWRRDETGTLTDAVNQLADAWAVDRGDPLIDLINASDEATAVSYLGTEFAAASGAPHVEEASGNIINDITSAEVGALNIVDITAPTPEEIVESILGVMGHMRSWKDNAGRPINRTMKKVGFVCGDAVLMSAAEIAISANHLAGGETGMIANNPNIQVEMIYDPRINWGTTEFALARLDGARLPFVVNEEDPLSLQIYDENSDFYKDNTAFKFKASGVDGYGYVEPRSWAKSTLV